MTDARTAVCVVGMHRSGTSLAGALVELVGVDFGPEERLRAGAPDNPKGFWENRDVIELNRELVHRLGGHDMALPPQPEGWERRPALEPFRERARDVLSSTFAGSGPFGFKHPVTVLLLPFWQAVIPEEIRYVVCLRGPLDVARSLEARNGFPIEASVRAWTQFTACALFHTRHGARLVLPLEDLVRPEGVLSRLADFVGTDPPDESALRRAKGLVDPELIHHRTPIEHDLADPAVPAEACLLYVAALALARGADGELSGLAERLAEPLARGEPGQAERELVDLRRELQRATGEVVAARERAQSLEGRLALRLVERTLPQGSRRRRWYDRMGGSGRR